MVHNYKKTYISLLFVVLLLFSAINLYGGERIEQPSSVFYHRFAASVSGLEAVWINPAGLGFDRKFKMQYIAMFHDGDFTKDWGTVMSGDGFGISFRRVEDYNGARYDEYIYASGLSVGNGTYMGASYRYIKTGFEYLHKRHFWNIGIIYNRHSQFSLGAVFSNLNRGEVNGEKSDMEQIYSVSYLSKNEKFIISVETSLSSQQSLSQAKYNYGVEWRAKPNLNIFANYNNDKFFQIGFKLDLKEYFLGTQSRGEADNNKHLGTSVFTGIVKTLTAR